MEDSSETQKPILQCICLNARSLLPKRYDLLGYLSSLSVDIVAVTETFLDDSVLSSQFCPPHLHLFVETVIDMVVEYYSFLLSHLSLPLEELTLKLIVKCSGLKSKLETVHCCLVFSIVHPILMLPCWMK